PGYFGYQNSSYGRHHFRLMLDYQNYALGVGTDIDGERLTLNLGYIHRHLKIGYALYNEDSQLGLVKRKAIHEVSIQVVFSYFKQDEHDGFNLNKIHRED
ncbi:MAG: hypothetical protein MRY83_02285, partial [Flavobacteriales bacterium]|nr:hypothetical protein [Flavobacteriales bacterium]